MSFPSLFLSFSLTKKKTKAQQILMVPHSMSQTHSKAQADFGLALTWSQASSNGNDGNSALG